MLPSDVQESLRELPPVQVIGELLFSVLERQGAIICALLAGCSALLKP